MKNNRGLKTHLYLFLWCYVACGALWEIKLSEQKQNLEKTIKQNWSSPLETFCAELHAWCKLELLLLDSRALRGPRAYIENAFQ